MKRVAAGVAAVIGYVSREGAASSAEATDVATHLAARRTDLALERNFLAAERTLMGWIRTTLAMISFGFTIGKLGQALEQVEVKWLPLGTRVISVDGVAYFLVMLGTLSLAAATVQFRLRSNQLKRMGLPRQVSIAMTVGLLLCAVGGFAFTALAMNL